MKLATGFINSFKAKKPTPHPEYYRYSLDDPFFSDSLGLKCGLEIHHQLATRGKLFCRCPAGYVHREPDAKVRRHMRPTLSELGEYDGTALMEFKTKKEVYYHLYNDRVCTYEMDDTPPFPIDKEAVRYGIKIALMLGCHIVDEMHITRKQYLDGSIPTGFQRTAIIGLDGSVPYRDRAIRIRQLNVEEDACRELWDKGHRIGFSTDRLGIPLVEVITAPDMHTPLEPGEVATLLGRLLRVSGVVRRGIGAVRQDVNVSIKGGTRVEIKGVPKIEYIPRLVYTEALRQKALLEIKDELRQRAVYPRNYRAEKQEVSHLFQNTKCELLRQAILKGHSIGAVVLYGFGGLLSTPTQPGITFAQEFSGRVRVIACLDQKPNLLHSDDPAAWGCPIEEIKGLMKHFAARHTDAVLLTWGAKDDVITAMEEIRIRGLEAVKMGVPNETRQAFSDGTTDFERILPGPDRMYPDTDSPPTVIRRELVNEIAESLPEPPWSREQRYIEQLAISPQIAYELSFSERAELFDRIVQKTRADPRLVAVTLTQTYRWLKREGYHIERIDDAQYLELFKMYENGIFAKEAIPDVLAKVAGDMSIQQAISSLRLEPLDSTALVVRIKDILNDNRKLLSAIDDNEKRFNFAMGLIMEELRGHADGGQIAKIVRDIL